MSRPLKPFDDYLTERKTEIIYTPFTGQSRDTLTQTKLISGLTNPSPQELKGYLRKVNSGQSGRWVYDIKQKRLFVWSAFGSVIHGEVAKGEDIEFQQYYKGMVSLKMVPDGPVGNPDVEQATIIVLNAGETARNSHGARKIPVFAALLKREPHTRIKIV